MKPRTLSLLLIPLALAGFGCSSSSPSPATPATQPAVSAPAPAAKSAYAVTLSGQAASGTLMLSLTRAFDVVRGSFTYMENGSSTSGMLLGDATGTDQLVFGMYTGRWDSFGAVTATWQGNTLMADITFDGHAPMSVALDPITSTSSAIFNVTTASGSDKRADGTDRCTFNFAMPVLTGGASSDALEAGNAAIRKDFGLGATSTPQSLSDEFISRCKADLDDLMSDTTTAEYAKDMTYDSETLFSVERNRDGIASYLIDSYDYEGGAHGMPGIYGVNLNLATGQSLTLGDLIKRDDLKALLQRVEQKVLTDYSDALFDEPLANFKQFVADKKPASESDLVTFAGLDNFYLTNTGIVFYWNVYEISPYAAGQLTEAIPFTDIKGMLRSDAPGASLIQ